MTDKMIINLPFAGFYHSHYDQELDYCLEREIEYQQEEGELHGLELHECYDAYFNACNWDIAHRDIAREYVGFFKDLLAEHGLEIGLEFESMKSPRFYNFETDRIFAYISEPDANTLFDAVEKAVLAETIRERFTSRDGFRSFYSNDIAEWLEKPIDEWDHNELGTLLLAFLEQKEVEDYDYSIFYRMVEQNTIDDAFFKALDSAKLEAALSDLKEAQQ